jgi:hypothetical protein
MQILFIISSAIFFVSVFLTLTSVKEEPYKLHKKPNNNHNKPIGILIRFIR